MKLIVEEKGRGFSKSHQARIADVRRKLKAVKPEEDAATLRILADALLSYSHSQYLLKRSGEDLVEWFKVYLDFLRHRDEKVKVFTFRPETSKSAFILVNTTDVPYLVDSLKNILHQLPQRATILSHPIFSVVREEGVLKSLETRSVQGTRESFMLVQLEGERELDTRQIEKDIRKVMQTALSVGHKRKQLKEKLGDISSLVEKQNQADFLAWIQNGNFICFGYAALAYSGSGVSVKDVEALEDVLGWLPQSIFPKKPKAGRCFELTEEARELLSRKKSLVVEVLDEQSPLYQKDNLIYFGYRENVSPQKKVEHLFVGLFTPNSINELASHITPLNEKLNLALQRQHIQEDSYDKRKVVEIFDTFPKVEMFFLKETEMDRLVKSFVSLQREQSVKLVVTRSLSLRGITLLVIMPRDYYSRDSIRRMESYLGRFLSAEHVSSQVIHFYSEYVSLHFRIVPSVEQVVLDVDSLQKVLTDLARPWDEKLRLLLLRGEKGGSQGNQLWNKFDNVFPNEYKDMIHPRFAVRDVRAIESVLNTGDDGFDLWGPFQEREESYRLQFYSLRESYLNDLMPYLENLSLAVVEEVDFVLEVGEQTVFVKSFAIRNLNPDAKSLNTLREKLLETLTGLRMGTIEDDYLNRLMVLTGLDWKEIDVFRAYRNYYFQLGNPFTKRRVAFALINNPQAALLLYRYFEARFQPNPEWKDPMAREEIALMPIRIELSRELDSIKDINEDRILRSLFNLIDSTVRSNFFLRRDDEDYFLSFKISAIGVIDMPLPRPMYETYVHSAEMEGIHLRGGKVARGGIRWSDRPDDFRTEVLGLVKAQMTKNALIVPVGSKGGFVVKTPFKTREEGAELSRQAYITLMRGLLDLVDNRVGGKVVRPKGIVVYDDEDPYLVVAADKGTAHLPDTANGVSLDYNFWLGDAFASGGSVGYDHKKLGITARGAWECVKRHFRELGKDIQNEDFTVVGIGDMSGDVFGNGMLLSKHTRLKAAFNHIHIFIDPDPDAASSWKERQRLFDLPRSTWADYNPKLISRGGGVWDRAAKEIPLSKEVREWLGVRHTTMEGEELIRRLLLADVELLWNGGIGTYVKSANEKNSDVGDRANDNVRVNANQIKARVIGEGGNLGLTQPARIEYALCGGLINTDAIDNSAGVDTSDHEVNLKIFYQGLMEDGVIKTQRTRNRQLVEVEDVVCEMVLDNNYTQSQCISLDLMRCNVDLEPFIDLSERLVNTGLLDRKGEFLPSRKDLTSRGTGYLRPELSILLAYSKMHLYQSLLESDLVDLESSERFLSSYFPDKTRQRYSSQILDHPLRREIIATMITNRVVDQAGCAFLNDLTRQCGATALEGVAAYLVFDEVLDGPAIRERVKAVDNKMSADRQYQLLLTLEKTLANLCRQVVEQSLPMRLHQDCVKNYRQRLATFRTHLADLLPEKEWLVCKETAAELVSEGFPEQMALEMASSRYLVGFLPAVHIAEATGAKLLEVTTAMSEMRLRLKISQVMECLNAFSSHDHWDRMALTSLRSAFIKQAVKLTRYVVEQGEGTHGYLSERRIKLDYYLSLVDSLCATPPPNASPYVVLLRALEALED